MNTLLSIIIVTSISLIALIIIWLIFVARKKIYKKIVRSLNTKLLLVVLPKNAKDEKKEDKDLIAVMEQFYSAVASTKIRKKGLFSPKPSITLEMAVAHAGEDISFYVAVPKSFLNDIEKQIYSYFPKSHITIVEDYSIFNPAGSHSGSYIKLEKDETLPVQTYRELEADPLKEITNALSSLREIGEGATLQILIRPAKGKIQKRGVKVAKKVQKGKSLEGAIEESKESLIFSLFKSAKLKDVKDGEKEFSAGDENAVKGLEAKSSKSHLDVNIRLVTSASSQQRADEILRQIENSFAQFSHPVFNKFKIVNLKSRTAKKFFFSYAYRLFDESEKVTLSVEELAGIYHFPNTNLETPRVKTASAKTSEPPSDLAKEGLLLGHNLYRGEDKKIFMPENDRRRHTYVIGQTGTGKSAFIKNMIMQDIINGEGVGLIDPHGDIAEEVLGMIPESRYEDVVYFDPSNMSRPVGLNMLQYDPNYPEQKTFVVNELMNIFDKLYDLKATGGPMFEQYARNAMLLLMEHPDRGFTILEIPKVLADKEFRQSLLENCTNVLVRDFWQKEAEKAGGEASLQNIVPYITSKFNVFLANDYTRPIIAQSKTSIDFRDIMDSKKILIVNLSKGRLGEVSSSLLGLIIVGKILMASFSRVDLPEDQRNDFYFYIDEFQNFATDSISTILSEARKYRLDLIIAHQFIEQLKKEIKDAVFGNVGSMISFRVGVNDAEFMAKQYEPVFDETDLANIDNYNAYVKLLINGKTTKPFSMATYPPDTGSSAVATKVREISARKYGRDRAEVEQELMERLRPEYMEGGAEGVIEGNEV